MAQVVGQYRYQTPHYYEVGTGPLPGATLWEQATPIQPFHCDPAGFFVFHDDFTDTATTNAINGWTTTVATSGTVTNLATGLNGTIAVSAGAVTAGQGINIQMHGVPFKIAASKPVFYEARLQFTGLTSLKIQFFAGLAEQSTAIITANALADKMLCGFAGVVTDGVILGTAQTAAATVTTGTGFTIVNNAWYRLGMIATSTGIGYYVNGSLVSTVAATLPTNALAPAFVVQGNATVTPIVNIDYVRVAGYRQ